MPRTPSWWIAVALLLAVYAGLRAHNASERLQNDFATYYLRASDAAAGLDPYRDVQRQSPYIYPPLLLALVRPLTRLPVDQAAITWALGQILALVWCVRLAARILIASGRRAPSWLLWLPALLALRFVLRELGLGQVNLMVLALTLAGLYALVAGRDATAGLLLGLATTLKILPGLFGLLLVGRGRWRAIAWMAVGAGVLAGFAIPALIWGPSRTVEITECFVRGRIVSNLSDLHMDVHGANQSLYALLMRLFTHTTALVPGWSAGGEWFINVADLPRERVALAFMVVTVALLIETTRTIARAREWALPECIALLFCLTAIISRKTWEEHLVTFVQVYATLLLPRSGSATQAAGAAGDPHPCVSFPIIAMVGLTWFYAPIFVGGVWSDRLQALGPATVASLIGWLWLRQSILKSTSQS